MSGIATEVLIILLLLVLNGVFAMSEIAVVTARKIRLEHRAEAGDKGAQAALELAREPTQFLSTVQVGITLIGVLAGAFGGASIAEQLADRFRGSATFAPYADAMGLGIVVAAITYLSLIIGELVPKRIALAAPERIAAAIARPMGMLARAVSPVVRVLTGSTNLMLRLLGVRAHGEPGLTEEEIRAVLEQGAESGVVEPAEHEIVESVFRLGDRNVGSIMTPRPELDWIDVADQSGDANQALVAQLAAERRGMYLVCEEELDRFTGFAHAEDLLAQCLSGGAVDLGAVRAAVRSPLFVPAAMPVLQLLGAFRSSREYAAVVLDEYGGLEGLVTLHDVLEALVGELPSVDDDDAPSIVRREDGSWLMDGALPVIDVEAKLDLDLHEETGPTGYQTLGGFVLAQLGRLPQVGDHVSWHEHRFEVVDMDGRRIDKVLVAPPAQGREAGARTAGSSDAGDEPPIRPRDG